PGFGCCSLGMIIALALTLRSVEFSSPALIPNGLSEENSSLSIDTSILGMLFSRFNAADFVPK
ncbi:hypothetical protein, partial [Vibrio parahaemolyticus]|uniref:hypothetical protein n=1 Tax=Vibrio parahaemolyticus TaxID=670 RepID=UPI001C5F9503